MACRAPALVAADVAAVVRLLKRQPGATWRDAAALLGCSRSAAGHYMRRARAIPAEPLDLTPAAASRLANVRAYLQRHEAATARQVAEQFGMGIGTARGVLRMCDRRITIPRFLDIK